MRLELSSGWLFGGGLDAMEDGLKCVFQLHDAVLIYLNDRNEALRSVFNHV